MVTRGFAENRYNEEAVDTFELKSPERYSEGSYLNFLVLVDSPVFITRGIVYLMPQGCPICITNPIQPHLLDIPRESNPSSRSRSPNETAWSFSQPVLTRHAPSILVSSYAYSSRMRTILAWVFSKTFSHPVRLLLELLLEAPVDYPRSLKAGRGRHQRVH